MENEMLINESKNQLIIYAVELLRLGTWTAENLCKKGTAVYQKTKEELHDLYEEARYFQNDTVISGYIKELQESGKEEIVELILAYVSHLQAVNVYTDSIFTLNKKDTDELIHMEEKPLAKILDIAYQYGNEVVRKRIDEYLLDKNRIIFDLSGKNEPEGKAELLDNRMVYHLSSDFFRETSPEEALKASIILAHEFHHTGDSATELEEEVNAFIASMEMYKRVRDESGLVLNDDNLNSLYELYRRLNKDELNVLFEISEKNFPIAKSIISGIGSKITDINDFIEQKVDSFINKKSIECKRFKYHILKI